jgi:hypothetical protein
VSVEERVIGNQPGRGLENRRRVGSLLGQSAIQAERLPDD